METRSIRNGVKMPWKSRGKPRGKLWRKIFVQSEWIPLRGWGVVQFDEPKQEKSRQRRSVGAKKHGRLPLRVCDRGPLLKEYFFFISFIIRHWTLRVFIGCMTQWYDAVLRGSLAVTHPKGHIIVMHFNEILLQCISFPNRSNAMPKRKYFYLK